MLNFLGKIGKNFFKEFVEISFGAFYSIVKSWESIVTKDVPNHTKLGWVALADHIGRLINENWLVSLIMFVPVRGTGHIRASYLHMINLYQIPPFKAEP